MTRSERKAFLDVVAERNRDPNVLSGDAAIQYAIQQAAMGGD